VAWSGGGALATAALMTAFGPFGTYSALAAWPRALYWFMVIGIIWLQADLVSRFLYARLRHRLPQPLLLIPVLAGLLVSVPSTAVVLVANDIMLPASVRDTGGLDALQLYWKVTLVLIVVGLVFARITPADDPADEGSSPKSFDPPMDSGFAPPPGSAFRDRFPRGLTGDLLCLEMEDHYLRIHTADGSGLILFRMADAERELAAVDGLRVHRSWWVARAAVREVGRRGDRPVLQLVNGLTVPVGRTYRASLRDAGWLG